MASENTKTITDYISGDEVRWSPEEEQAVQPFCRMLVEDYGYPRDHVQAHPQWRVKVRPSDTKKEYPIDIAVFGHSEHSDENLHILVECKKKNRKDGRGQLQDYMRFSKARLGVWFNGEEKLFLLKHEREGEIHFREIPNIPRFVERIEDIGQYRRSDLKPAANLKSIFKTMRNYLAANAVGIARDEVFAQQIINLIFCKIYDERFTRPTDMVGFRAGFDEANDDVAERIKTIFDHVKRQYPDVIEQGDQISLDHRMIAYAVGELHLFSLTDSKRDAIAEAFEVFIGPSLKGAQGQFFTPRNVVNLLVDMIDLKVGDKIIDPACGSGGFLVQALRDVWAKVDQQGEDLGWPENEIIAEKQKTAIQNIRGIDKDSFLAKVAKAYMAILGDGRGGIFCDNSLDGENWSDKLRQDVGQLQFDALLTNPPYGKKLKIDDQRILKKYRLGRKWKRDRKTGDIEITSSVQKGQPPQILFIEFCLSLLRDGGRFAIIAPELMFANPSHRYIVEYINSVARIKAIVSFPEELFQPFTHAKVCGVLIEKTPVDVDDPHDVFMGIARWCGHDSRGLDIPHDDIPTINEKYTRYANTGVIDEDHIGFIKSNADIIDNIYLPKYYNPELTEKIEALSDTHDIFVFGDLMRKGVISVSTGDEIGKLAYGTGNIPFVRTSDIANWEIKLDPKQGVSEEIYEAYQSKQDVRAGDILMVRDGTYLVGTCAMITENDVRMLYQSHIYKIRVKKLKQMDPHLLLSLLSSPIVREQIYSKRFTQDIIDTLGQRIRELQLPIPKDAAKQTEIIQTVKTALDHKAKAKSLAREAALAITGDDHDDAFLTLVT